MGRTFITGDTHAGHDEFKLHRLNHNEPNLTKEDVVIICGDFGYVWDNLDCDQEALDYLDSLPWTTAFVEGNHDNLPAIREYSEMEWNGGLVQQLRPSIYHLERGEVFNINGHTFFAMGGAHSHDKRYRIEGKSWWPEEVPSQQERDYAMKHLPEKVDYILSHECPLFIAEQIRTWFDRGGNEYQEWLEELSKKTEFKAWFFGHHHVDHWFDEKYKCSFYEVYEVLE